MSTVSAISFILTIALIRIKNIDIIILILYVGDRFKIIHDPKLGPYVEWICIKLIAVFVAVWELFFFLVTYQTYV